MVTENVKFITRSDTSAWLVRFQLNLIKINCLQQDRNLAVCFSLSIYNHRVFWDIGKGCSRFINSKPKCNDAGGGNYTLLDELSKLETNRAPRSCAVAELDGSGFQVRLNLVL